MCTLGAAPCVTKPPCTQAVKCTDICHEVQRYSLPILEPQLLPYMQCRPLIKANTSTCVAYRHVFCVSVPVSISIASVD